MASQGAHVSDTLISHLSGCPLQHSGDEFGYQLTQFWKRARISGMFVHAIVRAFVGTPLGFSVPPSRSRSSSFLFLFPLPLPLSFPPFPSLGPHVSTHVFFFSLCLLTEGSDIKPGASCRSCCELFFGWLLTSPRVSPSGLRRHWSKPSQYRASQWQIPRTAAQLSSSPLNNLLLLSG